jgi:ferredoxin/flavodoxin---NADP+ reductase
MLMPDQISELRQKRYNGTVAYLKKVHSDLMVLRIKPDFNRPVHVPGQYCTLGLGNWEPRFPGCQEEILKEGDESKLIRRAYSISCSIFGQDSDLADIEKTDFIEFYIVLVREGTPEKPPALTPRLFMLKEGDRLQIGEKITGHYTLESVKENDNVIFLSTGTGEAPHNYMLWQLLKRGHQGKMLSACCVRMKQDLAFLSTHKQLEEKHSNYRYLGLTTREADTITHKIYIQDLIKSGKLEDTLGAKLDPTNTHVFLCGNPKMIGVPVKDPETGVRGYPKPEGIIEILEKRGFQTDNNAMKIKGNIHFEEYW